MIQSIHLTIILFVGNLNFFKNTKFDDAAFADDIDDDIDDDSDEQQQN